MIFVIAIAFWDVWKVLAALWCVRAILRCGLAWVAAAPGADWRVAAWRCEWEILRLAIALAVSAIAIGWQSLHYPEPDGLHMLVLVLLTIRAAINIAELVAVYKREVVPPIREDLRWRSFMFRLWQRKHTHLGLRHGLADLPRSLLSRRPGRG